MIKIQIIENYEIGQFNDETRLRSAPSDAQAQESLEGRLQAMCYLFQYQYPLL
jgi:hypothetical protein